MIDLSIDHLCPFFVGLSKGCPWDNLGSCHGDRPSFRPVVASVVEIDIRGSSEFAQDDNQGFLEHPSLGEVFDECRVGQIELATNGSYTYNGSPGGRWRVDGDRVVFDGVLAAWNQGVATLKDGVLEFYWTNADGSRNWFVFQR